MTRIRAAFLVAALFGFCVLPATPSQAQDWPAMAKALGIKPKQ